MTSIWDKFKKGLVDSLNDAIDKTEELTSVGKIKLEILQVEHRLDEKYIELGRYVFNRLKENSEQLPQDATIKKLRQEIRKLQTDLDAKERELGRIKEEDGIDFDS